MYNIYNPIYIYNHMYMYIYIYMYIPICIYIVTTMDWLWQVLFCGKLCPLPPNKMVSSYFSWECQVMLVHPAPLFSLQKTLQSCPDIAGGSPEGVP